MRIAGRPSWSFAENADEMQHAALYVRDALALDVPEAPDIPPRLDGVVPDRRALLDSDQRAMAATQWPSWWRAVVSWTTSRKGPPDGPDGGSWLREVQAGLARTGSPPDFDALADRPELQQVVVESYREACAWADGPRRRSQPPHGRSVFPYELVRETAEDVIFDRGVSADRVTGKAFLLAVEGPWWAFVAPGVVLCSQSALEDPSTTRTVLRATFESGLGI